MKLGYKHTTLACYLGMISQAIVNNLAPLLFIIFKDEFRVSDEQVARQRFDDRTDDHLNQPGGKAHADGRAV